MLFTMQGLIRTARKWTINAVEKQKLRSGPAPKCDRVGSRQRDRFHVSQIGLDHPDYPWRARCLRVSADAFLNTIFSPSSSFSAGSRQSIQQSQSQYGYGERLA